MKSKVWKHFGFPIEGETDGKQVKRDVCVCKICFAEIKYTGSTTNMSTHLKRHHPTIDFTDVVKQKRSSCDEIRLKADITKVKTSTEIDRLL